MRIGKFKQIIEISTDNTHNLQIESSPIFGGQAYQIKGLPKKIKLIKELAEKNLVANIPDNVKVIFDKNENSSEMAQISAQDNQALTTYFSQINARLPLIYESIAAFSEKQDEQIINIKLPKNATKLDDLNNFNSRLVIIFKDLNITGEFTVSGFDKGSKWYEILISTEPLYKYFVGILGLAYLLVKLKKEYYESEIVKHTAKAVDKTPKEIAQTVANEKLEEESNKMVKKIGIPNGQTEGELVGIVMKTTKDIIKELGSGVEFHLSLNPPKYVSENNKGSILQIDYSSIPKIESEEESVVKQIEPTIIGKAEGETK